MDSENIGMNNKRLIGGGAERPKAGRAASIVFLEKISVSVSLWCGSGTTMVMRFISHSSSGPSYGGGGVILLSIWPSSRPTPFLLIN